MVERNHQCQICGLKFQSEGMILVHKCSGCPKKKYACEFCDHYRSESSSDIEKHMRIHTNDKCYVCKICGFSTAWKKNLKEHMVKHLGLKPYVCHMCGYSTSDRHNLRSHKLKHYQKGEGCEKCGGECRCNQPQVPAKKRKMSEISMGENINNANTRNSPAAGASSSTSSMAEAKELECPFPNCVYRTKLEFMMTNHMVRHQGGVAQRIVSPGSNASNRQSEPTNSQRQQDGVKITAAEQSHRRSDVMTNDASQFLGRAPSALASSALVQPKSVASSSQNTMTTAHQLASLSTHQNIGQLQPPTMMLSPPSHFQPLIQQPTYQVTSQPVNSGMIPQWVTSTAAVVPTGLIANTMTVFPNMPN